MHVREFFLLRHRGLTHLLFLGASLVTPFVAAYLAMEIQMASHLIQTGETRASQSDNYGLAFEALLLGVATFSLTLPVMPAIWWRMMRTPGR